LCARLLSVSKMQSAWPRTRTRTRTRTRIWRVSGLGDEVRRRYAPLLVECTDVCGRVQQPRDRAAVALHGSRRNAVDVHMTAVCGQRVLVEADDRIQCVEADDGRQRVDAAAQRVLCQRLHVKRQVVVVAAAQGLHVNAHGHRVREQPLHAAVHEHQSLHRVHRHVARHGAQLAIIIIVRAAQGRQCGRLQIVRNGAVRRRTCSRHVNDQRVGGGCEHGNRRT
jgi:hypothetical protein